MRSWSSWVRGHSPTPAHTTLWCESCTHCREFRCVPCRHNSAKHHRCVGRVSYTVFSIMQWYRTIRDDAWRQFGSFHPARRWCFWKVEHHQAHSEAPSDGRFVLHKVMVVLSVHVSLILATTKTVMESSLDLNQMRFTFWRSDTNIWPGLTNCRLLGHVISQTLKLDSPRTAYCCCASSVLFPDISRRVARGGQQLQLIKQGSSSEANLFGCCRTR